MTTPARPRDPPGRERRLRRAELLDAVLADTVQAQVQVAEHALAMDDPWDGFRYYLEETCRLQAAVRAAGAPDD
jgi:hypothetical protein